MAGGEWQCRKHPLADFGGVCPHCLRERLLRLCPDCAHVRPCPCPCASSSSPSSSSSISCGAVDRVSSLIERERQIARSRSVAGGGERQGSKVWGWPLFSKGAADGEEEEGVGLARSSSVSATTLDAKAKANVSKAGWRWLFASPMKVFRHRKPAAATGR